MTSSSQESTISSSSSSWSFRPSALDEQYFLKNRPGLIRDYNADNQRAVAEGVKILPRISTTLRTLQWNVHSWATAEGEFLEDEFFDALLRADADVLVLNEYSRIDGLEQRLKHKYTTILCGSVPYPTAVATSWHVFDQREVVLPGTQDCGDRSALFLWIGKDAKVEPKNRVWILGTHLDDQNGSLRNQQISTLLNDWIHGENGENGENGNRNSRAILLGDFNQQRQNDYTDSEWQHISQSMERRNALEDDGVSTILHTMGFRSSWDDTVKTNWITTKPPSTHWSGTIVDYSYGKNIIPLQVSIGPEGCSDHRLTVCDWDVEGAAVNPRNLPFLQIYTVGICLCVWMILKKVL